MSRFSVFGVEIPRTFHIIFLKIDQQAKSCHLPLALCPPSHDSLGSFIPHVPLGREDKSNNEYIRRKSIVPSSLDWILGTKRGLSAEQNLI